MNLVDAGLDGLGTEVSNLEELLSAAVAAIQE
jgi:hypothetical protein